MQYYFFCVKFMGILKIPIYLITFTVLVVIQNEVNSQQEGCIILTMTNQK